MADPSPPRGRWAFRPVPPELHDPSSSWSAPARWTRSWPRRSGCWSRRACRWSSRPRPRGRQVHAPERPARFPATGHACGRARRRGRDVRLAAAGARARLASGPRHARPATGPAPPIRPDSTVLLIPELSDHLPAYTWGAEARIAIRAASIGYGLAATIHADSLDEVFEALRRPPVELADDELSRLGVVLVLRAVGGRTASRRRRPLHPPDRPGRARPRPAPRAGRPRDVGPRPRRLRALRLGDRPRARACASVGAAGDFELEVDRRRDFLADLVAAGRHRRRRGPPAIDGYRLTVARRHPTATAAPN